MTVRPIRFSTMRRRVCLALSLVWLGFACGAMAQPTTSVGEPNICQRDPGRPSCIQASATSNDSTSTASGSSSYGKLPENPGSVALRGVVGGAAVGGLAGALYCWPLAWFPPSFAACMATGVLAGTVLGAGTALDASRRSQNPAAPPASSGAKPVSEPAAVDDGTLDPL